jgi:hypothetical protein
MSVNERITGNGAPYNYWGVDSSDIPGGVILGLSFVIVEKRQTVYLSSLTVKDNALSLSFSQNGKTIAHGTTTQENSVLFLETISPCSYAAVDVGAFYGMDIDSERSIKIKPTCVLVSPLPPVEENTLRVTQDGVSDTVKMTKDYTLLVDYKFSCDYDEESKELFIKLSEEKHRELTVAYSYIDPVVRRVTSINHAKPDDNGVIYLTIRNTTGNLSLGVSDEAPILTISSDLSPCISEDVIDSYISPDLVRSFSYMPLDEAYDKVEDSGKHIRNTFSNLIGSNKIDPMFDRISL